MGHFKVLVSLLWLKPVLGMQVRFSKLDTIASDLYLDRNLKELPLMQHSRNHEKLYSHKSEVS